jgi:hypothetical protein
MYKERETEMKPSVYRKETERREKQHSKRKKEKN